MKQNIIKIYLCFIVALLTVFGGNTYKAMAEGSITINPYTNTTKYPKDSAFRTFMEYQDGSQYKDNKYQLNSTMNQWRKQIVYVYIQEGETVYFGSSIDDSRLDINHENIKKESYVDIVVVDPEGIATGYDVNKKNNGVGYIDSREKEIAGPWIEGTTKNNKYDPLKFTATKTGWYEFHFHSLSGGQDGGRDPYQQRNFDLENHLRPGDDYGQGYGCVGAWDVTVVKPNSTKGEIGRMFTYMVAWNTGSNGTNALMSASLYAASKEGFIYKTTFTEMNPWGFIFFGDPKGIMHRDTGASAYSTFYGIDNQIGDVVYAVDSKYRDQVEYKVDDKDRFMLFFNEPSADIPEKYLPKTVKAPKNVEQLAFVGSIEGNKSYEGEGGAFKFTIPDNKNADGISSAEVSSVMITIDFTAYDQANGNKTNYGKVYLQSSDVHVGDDNYIYWDGKGADGTVVPAGVYNDQSVKVTATSRGGEYHFVLIDVEDNTQGIKVERLNTQILDQDNNPISLTGMNDKYWIYYNADDSKTITGKATTGIKNYVDGNSGQGNPTGKDYTFSGMSSQNGAVKFNIGAKYESNKHSSNTNSGDRMAVDIWTYISMPIPMPTVEGKQFEIIKVDDEQPYIPGGIDINFAKADSENPTKLLGGAKYGVYINESCTSGNEIAIIETDSEGKATYNINVKNKVVYIKEIKAPDGYELDETSVVKYRLELTDGTQQIKLQHAGGSGVTEEKYASCDSDKVFDTYYGTSYPNSYYDGPKGGYAVAYFGEKDSIPDLYYVTKVGYCPRYRSGKNINTFGQRMSGAMFYVSSDGKEWNGEGKEWTLIKKLGAFTDTHTFEMHEVEIDAQNQKVGSYIKFQSDPNQACNVAEVVAYGLKGLDFSATGNGADKAYANLMDSKIDTTVSLNRGEYIVADMGSLYEMKGVLVRTTEKDAEHLTNVRIEISDDGVNWSLIKRSFKETDGYFDLPAATRYIRVSLPDNDGIGKINIADIAPFGSKYELYEGDTKITNIDSYLKTLTDIAKKGFFLKIFKNDKNGQPLSDASFGLFENVADTSDVSKATEVKASDNGVVTYTTEFVIGDTYYLVETKAPEGYKLDGTVHKLVVKDDGIYEEVDGNQTILSKESDNITSYMTLTNELKSFLLEIIKSDSADGTIKLPGAVFSIYENVADITSGATAYDTLTTAETTGLAVGTQPLVYGKTYYLVETQAPTGYVLDSNTVHVLEVKDEGICKVVDGTSTLLDNGTTPLSYAISLTNNKKTFLLKLIKQSLADENALLPNAVFGLYTSLDDAVEDKADGKIILTTEANGTIQLTDANALIYGKTYYIKETQAPEGYIVDLTIHTLKIEDDGIYEVLGDTKTKLDDTSGIAVMRFKNIPELELPVTGAWFTGDVMKLLGLLIFAVCGSALVARRKMNA